MRYYTFLVVPNFINKYYYIDMLEVWGPVGPRLLVGGPLGRLFALQASLTSPFALHALQALRPCDPRTDAGVGNIR